jgi:N-acetyl-gamma-glutamyl-phosphate reductase
MHKIFIDGAEGTTGMVIRGLLAPFEKAGKISLINVKDRKDPAQRKAAYQAADLAVMCLPDDAARAAMEFVKGAKTRVLDASSAHRTAAGWVYGFPELSKGQAKKIANARFVSNPGCFATGAVSLLRPLVDAKLIDSRKALTVFGVSGYTGGGKKMIARFEAGAGDENFAAANAVGAYSINERHKHVREIEKHAGLKTAPLFMPHVVNLPRGMIVSAAFNRAALKGTILDVQRAYESAYAREAGAVKILPLETTDRRLDFSRFALLNRKGSKEPPLPTLEIYVKGWKEGGDGQVTVFASLDNLGKGAGVQAVQNIRLMLGV